MNFHIALSLDISTLTRPLPPNCNFVLNFARNSDDFTILSKSSEYSLKICDLYLEVTKIIPDASVLNQIERRFISQPMVFPLTRSKLLKYSVPKGVFDGSQYNVFTGEDLPRFILIGFVDQQAFAGAAVKNPYCFQHFNLSEISISHNNLPIPATPYRPDFKNEKFYRMYQSFFDNLGIYHSDSSNAMTPDMYRGGMFLVPWDLSPDKCNGYHRHRGMSGEISISLRFAKTTPCVITMIIYAVYETSFTISKTDGVVTNYTL